MAEKTKKTERKPLNNNLILMIVSGIVAVIIWFSLVLTAFPETTVIIKDVPIDYALDGSYADISGLSIIGEVIPTVNVRVSGLRYIIGDYKPEDLIGKTLAMIVNLEPRKMMGYESNGMILSVKYGDGYRVVEFDDSVLPGSDIS